MALLPREHRNWLIHALLTRQEHEEALRLIEESLRACGGLSEYALHAKGLIRRLQGGVAEALQLSQAALAYLRPETAQAMFVHRRWR
jgi:glycyl-tRNA synthetase (class II)